MDRRIFSKASRLRGLVLHRDNIPVCILYFRIVQRGKGRCSKKRPLVVCLSFRAVILNYFFTRTLILTAPWKTTSLLFVRAFYGLSLSLTRTLYLYNNLFELLERLSDLVWRTDFSRYRRLEKHFLAFRQSCVWCSLS